MAERQSQFVVEGMTCGNCARRVSDAARTVSGVSAAEARAEAGRLTVWWAAEAQLDPGAVVQAVRGAGYPTSEATSASVTPALSAGSPVSGWRFNVILGAVCTIPLMIGEWAFHAHSSPTFRIVSVHLSTIAMVGCGYRFARGAWEQMKVGVFGMDVLVSLGALAAYSFSIFGWASGLNGHLYFMEAAAILTFISAGHWLEARVGAEAESSLKALLRLAPSYAHRREADGREEAVPIDQLRVGDSVVLHPGDRVPTDGLVIEGESNVDEAMLTGESNPVKKTTRAEVFAGTMNIDGQIVFQVSATGEATSLAQIISAVRRAQTSRARIQRLADQVSQIFVPTVIGLSLLTFLVWGFFFGSMQALHESLGRWLWTSTLAPNPWANAVISATAVLIIACPCAMGLATPAAIMAAANAAARRGILLRDGVALEKAGEITTVLFDKTGTLTEGHPAVLEFVEVSGGKVRAASEPLRSIAASLARPSRHPLSKALAAITDASTLLQEWSEVRGSGVQARLALEILPWSVGSEVRLGSMEWVMNSTERPEPERAWRDRWLTEGATILALSLAGETVALVAVRDRIRREAREVLDQLKAQGKKVRVVSGDLRSAALSIGMELGLRPEEIFAEVKPDQKAGILRELQAQGHRVAFVGDGINDAPALAQADLGIAVTQASDVARESADLVLLRADLRAVPESLGLARAALATIRQNLFWAFFYNAVAVSFAALGFMNPMLCAAAMGLSDVLVIGNSLRLLRWHGRSS